MPQCFVLGCKNSNRTQRNISFHIIPHNARFDWLKAIGRPLDTFIIQQRVCSEHFLEANYEIGFNRRQLKRGTVPTINLPIQDSDSDTLSNPNSEFNNLEAYTSSEKDLISSGNTDEEEDKENGPSSSDSSNKSEEENKPSCSGIKRKYPNKTDRFVLGSQSTNVLHEKIGESPYSVSSGSSSCKRRLIKKMHPYSNSPERIIQNKLRQHKKE